MQVAIAQSVQRELATTDQLEQLAIVGIELERTPIERQAPLQLSVLGKELTRALRELGRGGFVHGHPFQRLDQLVSGDKVILTTPFQTCTYQILASVDGHANPYVTDPNDWTVIAQTAKPMLTMSTCTPEGTARQRLVARAQLVSATNTVPGASVK